VTLGWLDWAWFTAMVLLTISVVLGSYLEAKTRSEARRLLLELQTEIAMLGAVLDALAHNPKVK